ncbi:MAG TPA: crosslink repair DNA glycosylase YcaQ family protein [Terriglobia bacterium]|nr:crosslink repair DNA glycosylase YcaQ family protein [Terriglobia bacterium]
MRRQYLDRPFPSKDILELIKASGWIYSPGCSTPYLSLWARMTGFKAEDLNRLVFDEKKLVQLETLRGCTMLVPREQAAIALRIRSHTFTELAKQARSQMPISEGDMEKLKVSVLRALEGGTRSTDQLARAVPATLIKDFGPELKRIGFSNSLSLSINLLKEDGRIVKTHTRRRLDSTDYSYALLSSVLPEVDPFEMRSQEACAKLAAQYFKAEAPARVRDFAWWAGVNVTDAIRAVSEVKPKLIPVFVEGSKEEYMISEADLDALHSFTPDEPVLSFIPYRDMYLKGQREIVDRFVRNEHADKPFSRWKGKLINDPLATIVRNGQVIGVWEWNESDHNVDSVLFEDAPKPLEKLVRKQADALATFIRANLGEIRLQGLDYGPHQMTGIRQLKVFWGKGAHVNVGA